jgi:hypothetical protein
MVKKESMQKAILATPLEVLNQFEAHDYTLSTAFESRLRANSSKAFCYFEGKEISWAEFDHDVQKMQGFLLSKHIQAGDRVGIVAKNHTVVTVKNCDLRKNQWGLSMGKRRVMTELKERQIRSCNLLKENDAGVTLMYNYRDITINPWYDIMNSDLNEKEVEVDNNDNDNDDDDDDDDEVDSR